MRIDCAVPHLALRTFWADDHDDAGEPEPGGSVNTAGPRRRATDIIPADDETEGLFRQRERSLAASFSLTPSPDPDHQPRTRRLLEHVQWESLDALSAAASTASFDRHVEENTRFCAEIHVGVYDVLSRVSPP